MEFSDIWRFVFPAKKTDTYTYPTRPARFNKENSPFSSYKEDFYLLKSAREFFDRFFSKRHRNVLDVMGSGFALEDLSVGAEEYSGIIIVACDNRLASDIQKQQEKGISAIEIELNNSSFAGLKDMLRGPIDLIMSRPNEGLHTIPLNVDFYNNLFQLSYGLLSSDGFLIMQIPDSKTLIETGFDMPSFCQKCKSLGIYTEYIEEYDGKSSIEKYGLILIAKGESELPDLTTLQK